MNSPYPAHLEESLEVVPGELAGTYVLTGDLDVEADWDLADLAGGIDLGSQTSIRRGYGRLCEARLVGKDSVPPSEPDLLSLTIRSVEAGSRTFILKVRVGALQSHLSSNSTVSGNWSDKVRERFRSSRRLPRSKSQPSFVFASPRMQSASCVSRFKIKRFSFER